MRSVDRRNGLLIGSILFWLILCTGCEAVGEAVGGLAEVASGVVRGVAEVASGAILESPGERFGEFEVRMSRSNSITGRALEGLTRNGTARALVSLDEVGRVAARGEQLGTIDSTGVLRLRQQLSTPIRIEKGAIIEAGREVGRASVIALDEQVAVRSSPLQTSPIISSLRRGAVVDVMNVQNGWYQVRTTVGSTGWASAASVAVQLTTNSIDVHGVQRPLIVAFVPQDLVDGTRQAIRNLLRDIDRILVQVKP
jgi:hypothetical protein